MIYTNETIDFIQKKHKVIISKPYLKNVYRNTINFVKKSAIITLVGSTIFAGTANIVREYNEETTTENRIVDLDLGFGSVVIKNKDERSAIQIYDDMIQAAMNIDGLESFYKSYNNKKMAEKREFITNFITTVAAAGGVKVNKVVFEENTDYYGAYKGYNIIGISFSQNIIYVNNRLLRDPDFSTFLKSAFHETVHLVENMNIETNENINNYYFKIYNANYNYGNRVYNTKVPEVVAKLVAEKFRTIFQQKYYSKRNSNSTKNELINKVFNTILEEAVENDKILTARPQEYYNQLSVNEIIHIFMSNHFKSQNIKFDAKELEQSYLYDILNFVLEPEVFNTNYKDYSNSYTTNLNLIDNENELG